MVKPISTIEEAYNMVAQDERQRMIRPSTKSENVVLQATRAYDRNASVVFEHTEYAAAYNSCRPRRNRLVSIYCGQLGHTVHKCYKIYEYPPGYKSSNQGTSFHIPPFPLRGQNYYGPRPQFKSSTSANMVP